VNPQIRHAQRACEAAKARQAVVVWFDESGQFAVASYGETKAECTAVKPVCNAIHEAIHEGLLPVPGDKPRSSKREREMEAMQDERDAYQARAHDAEKKLAAIATLVSIYDKVSARRALTAIGETIGQQCSICRSRHGSEVRHACE